MSLKASLKFASSLIFPKAEKKSSARASLIGAVACIGLSLVPLVVVVSVADGMIDAMTERLIGLSSSHIQAYVASAISEVSTPENFIEYSSSYRNYDGVLNTYPEVSVSALASANKTRTGIQIRGMETDIFEKNSSFKNLFQVTEGSLEEYENPENKKEKNAVICKKLAENLNLHPGDTFRIITTRTFNGNVAPKLSSFKVSAVVTSGYQELDALWLFIPIDTAFSSLALSNASYTIMIETPDAFNADLVKLQRQLQTENGRYANFYRWSQVHDSEFQNFSSTKVMLVFIMMLIVLVACINVTSAVIMLVMERQKEIAILKSIGASPGSITLSFITAGGGCGLAGVITGVPLGIIISLASTKLIRILELIINFFVKIFYALKGQPLDSQSMVRLLNPDYYIQNYSVDLNPKTIALICIMTVLLSVVVSIIPAIKAGREKPLEILRKS